MKGSYPDPLPEICFSMTKHRNQDANSEKWVGPRTIQHDASISSVLFIVFFFYFFYWIEFSFITKLFWFIDYSPLAFRLMSLWNSWYINAILESFYQCLCDTHHYHHRQWSRYFHIIIIINVIINTHY